MRPLFHASGDDFTVEAILHALSDPVRVAIHARPWGRIARGRARIFATSPTAPFRNRHSASTSRRSGRRVRSEANARGVEMHNTPRCAEIEKRFPGLIGAIINAHKLRLEQKCPPAHAPGVSGKGARKALARQERASEAAAE